MLKFSSAWPWNGRSRFAFFTKPSPSGHVRNRTAAKPQAGNGHGNSGPHETGPDQGDDLVTRTSTILTLAILSSVLTPVVVMATTRAPETPPPVREAKIEAASVTTSATTAEQPACTRRVKVVYAGYGEAHASACTAAAEIRR